jgi:dual specificity phosphatase 12
LDWITREIAIGNIDDAIKVDRLHGAGIRGILCLNGWPNNATNSHGLAWRCVELIDGDGNDVSRLKEAIWHLHELVANGAVLVHCMEGVSRSALVVASYLAETTRRPFEACLEDVARLRKRVFLQPGLFDLRRAYESTTQPHERLSRAPARHTVLQMSDD